ncbi:MATE family efflux transporter [Teredinibacter purpureus]|uniref:MATE family efflux transporter n=1 Tax=Teredinibacter purpureus TaxID=2731756 RepID=UPI001F35667E|nr:MATE family efflux transporter [Teredinibacter purpureus]
MIISNISAPLMGIADTAMLGHLDSALYLGAVAIGSNILALLLWMFAFLRMGTTGFVGRAVGAGDSVELMHQLGQTIALALLCGLFMILTQWITIPLVIHLMNPPPEMAELASRYCHIRITAAPAAFLTFVIIGLLIGLQNARLPLVITVVANGLNVALDYLFIVVYNWNSEGAAYASLIAEILGAILAVWLGFRALHHHFGAALRWPPFAHLFNVSRWALLMRLNGDLFVRTALLLLVFNFFIAQSAQLGPTLLAANAILIQLVLFQSFGLDGYAHAAEAMGAKALGSGSQSNFMKACAASVSAGAALAFCIVFFFTACKATIITLFTDIEPVAQAVSVHFYWLLLFPVVSIWTYILDGIFIGAGKTRIMLKTMCISVFFGFLPLWWLSTTWGNHGLWMSFVIFNAIRGATLGRAFYTLTARHKWF